MPMVYEETNVCSESASMFWKFTWSYFKSKSFIKFYAVKDTSLEFSIQILECGMKSYNLPFEILNKRRQDVYHYKPPVFKPRIVEGYIFISDSVQSLQSRLKVLSTMDANTKTVLILTDSTLENIEHLFKIAWNEYKLLNLILFRTSSDQILDISSYNPFYVNAKTKRRGLMYNFTLTNNVLHEILSITKTRLMNVYGYPLRVCVFDYPSSIKPDIYGPNGTVLKYSGKDGEIIHTICESSNFKPDYFPPRDGIRFGSIDENGTANGSIREIEDDRADILANLRGIIDYGQRNSVFLHPIDVKSYAFLTPKMGTSFEISFLKIFETCPAICLAVSYTGVLFIWRTFQKLYKFIMVPEEKPVEDLCQMIFSLAIMVSQRSPPKLDFERFLFVFVLFFSMINCYVYQAKMVQQLTRSNIQLDYNTLEDLAKSNLTILVNTGFKFLLKDIAREEDSSWYFKELYSRQELADNITEVVIRVAFERNAAVLVTLERAELISAMVYSNKTGKDMLHVLKQGPPTGYNAHMVPSNSPFKGRFNKILMRIRESGLMPKWADDEMEKINRMRLNRTRDESGEGDPDTYRLQELSFIFHAWAILCFISFIIFLIEIVYFYYKQRKLVLDAATEY